MRRSVLLAVIAVAACGGGASPTTRVATRTLDQRLDESLKPIPTGVRILARVSTYEIGGESVADARQMIAQQGRADGTGRRWAGFTTWRYSWRWEYERISSCEITNATVTLTLQVDVPVLSAAAQQDSTIRVWYDAWFNRLFEHEAGHARLARDGARDIYQRIRMLQGTSCDDVGNRANQIARQLVDSFNDRQREYDATTMHGARPAVTTPSTPPTRPPLLSLQR